MRIDLLDTPVRLTWDLHGLAAPLPDSEMLAIAGKIAAAGVFFVTLEERPLAHPAIVDIVAALAAGGCQLQLACTGSPAELASLQMLSAPLSAVQLDVAAFLESGILAVTRLQDVLSCLRALPVEPTVRLTPLTTNLSIIPQLLSFCAEHGVRRFKLPNARIGDSFPVNPSGVLPRWADLEKFRELWEKQVAPLPESLQLEIHDRFLWEIMTPEREQARSEYGGCQAGNSLGHVDDVGNVYACAAWPERFGSLRGDSLDDIWQSPRRLALLERIAQVPVGCCRCRDYALCLGGCRGLGEVLNQGCGGRDLMCREPRQ
jgi:GeoRSP system SPASM domain protein